jgi:hypothetical protein
MADILEGIRVKIERADHHITELDAAIRRFLEGRPYTVVGEIDAQGRPTYRISDMQPIDPIIAAIAGDAIQNIRTALDYLACLLWGRTNRGECKVSFPITDTAAKYKSEGLGKIKGMRQDAIDAISAVEPYHGGKGDILWRLHRLSIIDKHRLPITVAGANLGAHLPSLYPEMFPESAKSNPWILDVSQMRCPLKDNDVIFRDDSGRELKQDLQFPFFIALDEVGIFSCKPLIPALKEMADSVRSIVSSFGYLFV